MLAHNKSPDRQNQRRPKHAKGASKRARTRFGGQKSTFSLHEGQPAERAALPLRKARRARKLHVGAQPSFSPSAGCHPQRALRSPRPPSFASRFAPRRRAAESGGVRDGRPFDGCASRRAQPLSHSTCGSSCSAGAVSPPTMRVSGTVPARHQAAPFGRQTRLRLTPFRATAHAPHARARPIGALCGSTAAPVPSASAPPASLWP